MAFIIPRNQTMGESLQQAFGLAAPGLIQGAQQRQMGQLTQNDMAALGAALQGTGGTQAGSSPMQNFISPTGAVPAGGTGPANQGNIMNRVLSSAGQMQSKFGRDLIQKMIFEGIDPFGIKSAEAGQILAETGFLQGPKTELTRAQAEETLAKAGFIRGPQTEKALAEAGFIRGPKTALTFAQRDLALADAQASGQVTLGPGSNLFDRSTGRPIAGSPFKPEPPPSASQQLAQNKLDGINALKQRKANGTISPSESKLLEKATFGGGGGINIDLSSGQLLTAATSLRKEFNTDQRVKDFRILAPKFKNMLSFIDRSNKTGRKGPTDIALSKTFQKLTDLMSSVREGEYETTFRGQALLEKLRGGILKLKTGGEGMTPEFRQELVDTARLMFDDGKLFLNQAIEEKGSVADAFNIPRKQILGNIKPFDVSNTEKEFSDIFGTEQASAPINRNTLTEQDLDNPNLSIEQMQSLLQKK